MKVITAILLSVALFPISTAGQQKWDNTIIVKGVGFLQVCNTLLDAGYTIDKKDSELMIVKTEYRYAPKTKLSLKHSLNIRVKDSVAIIKGFWYNEGVIGTKFLGQEQMVENSTYIIENRAGQFKIVFDQMKSIAQSFGKPVLFSKE